MERLKQQINVALIGHVDSGKSTIAGRLLIEYDAKKRKDFEDIKDDASAMGASDMKYAWMVDVAKEERARSMTIDTTLFRFSTRKFDYLIANSPGQRTLIRNTVTSLCGADAALLVVAAEEKEFNAGMKSREGLTQEHAILAFTFGIKQLVVAVNKMNSVAYSEERFQQVKDEVSTMLEKIGFKPNKIQFVPVSGWSGDNLFQPSGNLAWYDGPTLIQALEDLVPKERSTTKPLRLPVRDVFNIRGVGMVIRGIVHTGTINDHIPLTIAPNNVQAKVESMQVNRRNLFDAYPGNEVGLCVNGQRGKIFRGDIVGSSSVGPPKNVLSIVAQVKLLTLPGKSIEVGRKTGEAIERSPQVLRSGESALITMTPKLPFCVETFEDFPSLGRLIIRDNGQTIGIGVVKKVTNGAFLHNVLKRKEVQETTYFLGKAAINKG